MAQPAKAGRWRITDAERYLLGLELFGMRFGLDRMRRLLTALDQPQDAFPAIHVVGSNGKSSTVRMAAAILERHGLRTGAYLSPHLVSFTERVRVSGADISEDDFAVAVQRAAHAAELVDRTLGRDDHVTQFEALTAAALSELADRKVDAAVVEAGLGGRYDATNVLASSVQVLTNVELEHTRWLGPTITDIATEKAEVVRPGGTLVLGPGLHPDARAVAERIAAERGATVVEAPEDSGVKLAGDAAAVAYQRRNFAVARTAAEAFLGELDPDAVADAAAHVTVPGRFEALDDQLVLDGAHNAAGMAAVVEALPGVLRDRPLVAVMAILDDKDPAAMLRELLPLCDQVVFCRIANPRALSPATLSSLAGQVGGIGADRVHTARDARDAVELARELAGRDGIVLATGSIYLLADLLRPANAGPGATL